MMSILDNVDFIQNEYQQVGQRALLNHIHEVAGSDPHRIAVHQLVAPNDNNPSEGKGISLSYQDFVTLVDRLCWAFQQRGVMSNAPCLAYLGPSDLRHLLIALAANKMSTAALLLSPRGSNAIYQLLLAQCNISVMLYDNAFSSSAEDLSVKQKIHVFQMDDLLDLLGDLTFVKPYPYEQKWSSLTSMPMAIVHTTGSTGMPKAVSISHSGLAAIDAQRLISQKDPKGVKCQLEILAEAKTIYIAFPLFHVAGFELSCYFLFSGCTLLFGYPRQPPNISILRDALRVNSMDGALLPPSIVEDISQDLDLLAKISKLRWVFSGGGSIRQNAGNLVAAKTRLLNGLGSTERGSFIQYPTDPSHWNYYHFHPWNGIDWRPVKTDQESTDFELVLRRDSSLQAYQGIFHNFPDIDEWPTKDVFRPHPWIQDLWEYRYRIDDLIVFSTGEKMNPVPVESQVNAIPGVAAAIVFGNKQSYPGLLVELEDVSLAQKSKDAIPEELKGPIEHALQLSNLHSTRDAQIHLAAVLIASPDRSFIRTPKGTVHRNKTLELYSADIDKLYHFIGSSHSANYGGLRLDLSREASLARDLAGILKRVSASPAPFGITNNIFAAGLDSKHVQINASILNKTLAAQTGMGDIVRVDTVYRNPTAQALAESILKSLSCPRNESEDQFCNFHAVLSRHAKSIPATPGPPRITRSANRHKHVLLTGTTGFVGSYVLRTLVQRKEVGRVTCLNRKKANESPSGLQQTCSDTVHVEYLKAELAEQYLGLPESIYHQLLTSVTDILHCQWAVDFNRPLEHFEPNIQGVGNLIKFSHASQTAAHIVFLSSIATVKSWDELTPVPEERLTAPSLVQTGYGESKLIASLLLDNASKSAHIPTSICRLGQVAGPVRSRPEGINADAWPERDWFPKLLRSSVELGCLPDTLGNADEIDWIPVDLVAELLCDLICSDQNSDYNTTGAKASYYHLVNPQRTRYSKLVPFLRGRLWPRGNHHVVSLKHWVTLLAERGLSGPQKTRPPGIELLVFFQGLASSDGEGSVILDTKRTGVQLPRLAVLEAVGKEWLGMWLDQWGFVCRDDSR